jgi:hypothetical protein
MRLISLEGADMNDELCINLPESPYQCGIDFIIEDERGRFIWTGAGRFEGDHCAFESFRTINQAAADALFRLAIADGNDSAEALLRGCLRSISLGKPPHHHSDHRELNHGF